jgi:hypothetical protein
MDEQTPLTEAEMAVLAFEHQRWLYPGSKDDAIRRTFDLSPVRYQQWLFDLIDKPAAYVHDPMLVKRLRRYRGTLQARRRHPAGSGTG